LDSHKFYNRTKVRSLQDQVGNDLHEYTRS